MLKSAVAKHPCWKLDYEDNLDGSAFAAPSLGRLSQ